MNILRVTKLILKQAEAQTFGVIGSAKEKYDDNYSSVTDFKFSEHAYYMDM